MAQNPDQPDKEFNQEVAILAKAQRLARFDDLDILGEYGERFGRDPDIEVFPFVRFDTIMAFKLMWKEKQEYRDRFQEIWKKLAQARESKQ